VKIRSLTETACCGMALAHVSEARERVLTNREMVAVEYNGTISAAYAQALSKSGIFCSAALAQLAVLAKLYAIAG
jgi:IS5 family transposase